MARRLELLADSFHRLLGRRLIPQGSGDPAEALWRAPFVVVAHDTRADPVFFFGNAVALRAFETDWTGLTAMPSRFSAEAPARGERQRLLDRVSRDGFIDDYSGIRVSATGRRFRIGNAVVWNIADDAGHRHGQAAMFAPPPFVADGGPGY
ncbi:MAG: MEKHLA domain-containing protein [Novosphingobium sp.]|nr:MEKHLA domain-containing protein [Novosphingobium sp.]